ncbi:hypothetical protein NUKP16_45360 [Klebsiella quasipneumoniae]|nr:hypothetical protein NUKP16_45360 [Klebsiella quasipneumoniae]GKQ05994.1 hypothetical protein NUKP771_45730 [Klebsiella quasipneumoniae]
MPLTDLEIRRAKPSEKADTKADGNGLSLQIEPNGSKGWRFRYRFEGKAKILSLGAYPKVSLSEARKKRDEAQVTCPQYLIQPSISNVVLFTFTFFISPSCCKL